MAPSQTLIELPAWIVASLPWLLAVLLLAVLATAAGTWVLVARTRVLEQLGSRLEALEDLRNSLARLAGDREDLDLRRVEHVLLEMRDGQRRLEDTLLEKVQSPRSPEAPEAAAGRPAGLAERVTNRLLALGYERVRLVTRLDDLEGLGASADGGSGEVLFEARRDGVLCKGRVLLRRGALTDVEMQPAYKLFP